MENRCLLRYTASVGHGVCIGNKTRTMQNVYIYVRGRGVLQRDIPINVLIGVVYLDP